MVTQEFRKNRARFPQEDLVKYRGSWVAFSPDGCCVVAAAETIDALEGRLASAGHEPQRLVFECVPGLEEDTMLGGEGMS